jgi:hypothetical protein
MAKSEYFEILGFSSLGEERRNITVLSNQASFDVPDPDPSDFFGAVVMRIGRANKEYLSEIVERLTQVENWCNETSNYLRSRLEGQQTAKGLFELGLLVGHHRESIAAQVSFQRLKDEFGLTELCTVAIDTLSDQRIADVATRMKCCEDQVGIWLQNAEK